MIRWLLPVAVIAALGAGGAMAATSAMHASAASVKAARNAKFGTVLVAGSGKTLYRYTVDSKGVDRCTRNATCAKYWPQLLVKGGAKPVAGAGIEASLLGTIAAKGGMRQVTYAGYPLYFFAGDTKAGEVNGQGFQKRWYVVNTKGALVKSALHSAGGTSGSSGGGYGTTTTSGGAWG